MSEEANIIIFVPRRHQSLEQEPYEVVKFPYVPKKPLRLYLQETRFTKHLSTLRLRHAIVKDGSRERVHTSSYVPCPNERFVFVPAGRSMS